MATRSRRDARQIAPDELAEMFRERIYGSIACLASLVVLLQHDTEGSPLSALLDVVIVLVSLWAASLLASFVGHTAASGIPGRSTVGRMARSAAQILPPGVVPVVLLALAGVGVMRYRPALTACVWVLVVQMGVFALFAVRRLTVPWWQRLLVVAALLVLGTGVVLLKIAAH